MAGVAYAAALKSVRKYRRVRRRIFGKLPPFVPDFISDTLDYVNPMKACFTAIAIWSSPNHFFKRIRKAIDGNSPFFPNPVKLLTTVSPWLVVCAHLGSLSLNKYWGITYMF